MKIATGLTLLAVGAIFAFAVRTSPPGVNIHIVGWVIMLTGVAGILLPGRASGWLRRRITVRRNLAEQAFGRRDRAGHSDRDSYPPYVLRDPAALASAILKDAELAGRSHRAGTAQDDAQTAQDDAQTAQDDAQTAQDDAQTAQDDAQTAPTTPGLTVVGPPGLTVVGPAGDEPPGPPGTLDDLLEDRAGQGRRR
jgi:hypothetical protein